MTEKQHNNVSDDYGPEALKVLEGLKPVRTVQRDLFRTRKPYSGSETA